MSKIAAVIIYRDKRTLEEYRVEFAEVVDEKHAMKIAKKLRPKYHKIVQVSISVAVKLD